MIYMDGIGFSFLIKEIKDQIQNYKITKIYQYDKTSFSLYFGKKNLSFQIKDNYTMFYIKDSKDINTEFQSPFLLTLKKCIQGGLLVDIRQEGYDRIVYFDFERINPFGEIEKYTLVFEIMGRASNIFFLENNKILSAINFSSLDEGTRTIMKGAEYTLPFKEKKISPLEANLSMFPLSSEKLINKFEGVGKMFAIECCESFEKFSSYIHNYVPRICETKKENDDLLITMTYNSFKEIEKKSINTIFFKTLNEAINHYFSVIFQSNVVNSKKRGLQKYIINKITRYEKIKKNVLKDMKKNDNYNKYKEIGDILSANMHSIQKGSESVTLFDFYNNCDINIELDSTISINNNLNNYYKLYNKGKRTETALINRLDDVENELNYLKNVKLFVEKETDIIGLEEIEKELNIFKPTKQQRSNNKNKKRDLLTFSYNNFNIFVGRNNKENDEITFSKARQNDIWLHVKDIAGSHVLIVSNNRSVEDDVILYASKLAAKYSQASVGNKVTVDYCEKKYVKKMPNYKLGNVRYTNFNSIVVEVE